MSSIAGITIKLLTKQLNKTHSDNFNGEYLWVRDKTADFKRDKTADFQNRTKQPILKQYKIAD